MKIKLYRLSLTRYLLAFFFFLSISFKAQNAFLISFPVDPPPSLTTCFGSSKLTVQLDATIASTTGGDVTIQLATGVNYVPGSVALVSTNAGLSIAENGGTANAPKFKVSPTAPATSISPGNRIVFTIDRTATCATRTHALASGIFKDTVTASIGASSDNKASSSYQINYPVLTFTQPAAQTNAVVGTTYTRTFNIKNGGNGCLSQLYLSLDNPSSGIQQISLQVTKHGTTSITPITITPTSTSGTTTYYTVPSSALPGGDLCTNEDITITETYKVLKCNAVTNYSAGWGCDPAPANWCETKTGSGSISTATGVPNLPLTFTRVSTGDFCTGDQWRYTITNSGTENTSGAGTAFGLVVQLGTGNWSTPQTVTQPNTAVYLQNFTINGVPITFNTRSAGQAWTLDLSQLTSDPDGAGGLTDADGDGQFDDLPVGASLVINYELKWDASNTFFATNTCNNSIDVTPNARVDYKNQCGASSNNYMLTPIYHRWVMTSTATTTAVGPTSVAGGTPFRVQFAFSQNESNGPVTTTPRIELAFTLPAGVTLNSTAGFFQQGNGALIPVTAVQTGSNVTVTYTYTNGMQLQSFYLDFVASCPGTSISFPYKLFYYQTTCPSVRYTLECGSYTAKVVCPCSPSVGVNNGVVSAERTTLGWTDRTLSTKVTAASLSSRSLKRMLPYDRARLSFTGTQSADAGYNDLHLNVSFGRPNISTSYINIIGGTVVVTDASTGNVYNLTLPAPTSTVTASLETHKYDLTPLLPSGFVFEEGDTYVLNMDIEYTGAATPGNAELTLPNSDFYFYNLASSVEKYCGNFGAELYIIPSTGQGIANFGQTTLGSGCTGGSLQAGFRQSFSTEFDPFPNEFRPAVYVDQVVFKLPTGFTYNPSQTTVFNMSNGYGNTNYNMPAPLISGATGNILTYVNDGTWPLPDQTNAPSASLTFNIPIVGTCAANTGTNTFDAPEIKVRSFYYRYTNAPVPPAIPDIATYPQTTYTGPTQNRNYTGKEALTIINQTGPLQASKQTESFAVRISNTGTSDSPYTWLAVPTLAGVNVTQIVDVATNTPLTLIPYSGGVWAKLSTTGLASGTSKDYRIDFTYTTCSSTTFQAIAGWNCSGYPSDPIAYACTASKADLTFVPQPAAVQINTIAEPVSPINLCTVLNYEFQVNSAAAGNLINNKFNITLPAGLTITPGSLLVEYPAGAGNWQAVTTTTSGYTTTLDLTAHSNYPAQGIPGTLNDGGNINNRLIGIKFNATTDCSFTSDSYVMVSTDANKTCGQPATGSGSLLNTITLTVSGSDPGYVLSPTITNPTTPITDCVSPITMHVKRVVVLSTASGTPSTATLRVNYPQGYTITNTTPNCYATTTFCPTFLNTGTDPVSGLGYAVYSIPAGMQTSDFLEFDITFTPTGSLSNGNYSTTITTDDVINGLSCSSVSGGYCTSAYVRTSTATYNFTLQCYCYKPAVTSGTALDTNHGITALGRAGADNSNWPMVRKGAWTALEAKTKGFVINRLTDAQISAISSADLVEGMMVYNISQDCLQINIDGTAAGWKCFNTQTCPDY